MRLMPRNATQFAAVAAVAAAALVAPAIALAAPTSPASHAGNAPSAAPGCQTPSLVEWIVPRGVTAGTFHYALNFTNLGPHACTMNGYPFLFAVGLSGHQIGHTAKFVKPSPHLITIASHGTATSALSITDVGNFSKSSCRPVWAAGLKVFPPNQTRAKIAPVPFQACSAPSKIFMFIGRPHL